MARRTPETLADYIVVGIAPALIMLLIGSLVFFLIGVFYQGGFPYRLTWVMGLFVLATVCIARISMEEGAAYAALFAWPLGIVVGIAVVRFVQIEGPLAPFSALINLSLLGLIWWCAHQLTWDCTLIDNRQDNTGQGLLQSMGWDIAGADSSDASQANAPMEAVTAAAPKRPWWQRLFGPKDQPAAHGRWVVYFSLAALPLFGLGQYFIPVDDVAGRRYAFWMLVIYVGSALGLLLTTSFLGLRRYIRQRQLEMPVEMAAAWLSVGVVMILGLLIVSALLPRPAPEYSLADAVQAKLGSFVSPERTASRLGFGPEGAPTDEQKSQSAADNPKAQPTESKNGKSEAGQGGAGNSQSQSQDNAASAQGEDKSESAAENGSQDQGSANGGDKSTSGESGGKHGSDPSNADPKSQSQGEKGGNSEQPDESSDGSEKKTNASEQDAGSTSEQSGERSDSAQGDSAAQQSAAQQSAAPAPRPAPPLTQVFSNLGNLLRYAFYAVIALIAAFLAWKYRRELAAAWQQLLKELRELLDGWFGRTQVAGDGGVTATPQPIAKTFRDYPDPFATGQAGRMSASQLVQYSFEALQAWSRDFATPRETGQTPHEFSETLALRQPAIDLPARQLAEIYSRMAYARQTPPAQTTAVLQTLWRTMTDIAQRPISAGTGGTPAGSA